MEVEIDIRLEIEFTTTMTISGIFLGNAIWASKDKKNFSMCLVGIVLGLDLW